MSRSDRAAIAAETLAILRAGRYASPGGREVVIEPEIGAAVAGTLLYRPGQLDKLVAAMTPGDIDTRSEARDETTLSAARRLVESFGPERVAALNFASARNPGGGFLSGAQAQEESLARASGLYACLETQPEYYDVNRREQSALYTDHVIYSPLMPVFRDDSDRLLEEPYLVSMITCPAVNAGVVRNNEPHNVERIEPTMRSRIEKVLAVAREQGQAALVLGAWGCGVFQNDPATIARLFADALFHGGRFTGAFEHVAFAVLDRRGEIIEPFRQVLV